MCGRNEVLSMYLKGSSEYRTINEVKRDLSIFGAFGKRDYRIDSVKQHCNDVIGNPNVRERIVSRLHGILDCENLPASRPRRLVASSTKRMQVAGGQRRIIAPLNARYASSQQHI